MEVAVSSLAVMPVTGLRGVGPKVAVALHQLNIYTVQDILFHLPSRYEDRTRITPITELIDGGKALVEGEVIAGNVQPGARQSLVCRIQDGTGALQLRFFHFNADQRALLTKPGVKLHCFGKIRAGFRGQFEMVHPQYRVVTENSQPIVEETLTPIYPTISGMTQTSWLKLTTQALTLLKQRHVLEELLPAHISQSPAITLSEALKIIHRPTPEVKLDLLLQGKHPAQQRLIFEELVAQQIGLNQFRSQFRARLAPNLTAN